MSVRLYEKGVVGELGTKPGDRTDWDGKLLPAKALGGRIGEAWTESVRRRAGMSIRVGRWLHDRRAKDRSGGKGAGLFMLGVEERRKARLASLATRALYSVVESLAHIQL